MDLKLYDTLTREKRVFEPLDPARVRMYVCGPTVYDFAHIGNARPVIVFDVLFRLLRHLYGADHVVYVRNITDVDDKINARAAERGVAIRELTEETYRYFKEDVAALGCLPPTVEPRATEYVRRTDGKLDMVTLIERLVRNQNAYIGDDHVLFYVPSMPDYGRLSRRSLDEMIAGARVEVAPYKRSPMDFVLWKPSDLRTSNQPLPQWQSPCDITTPGRPGWHIECSAMSGALLGETFDIHGGGIDLVFPHHENEIAQSRCAFHTPFMARYWMHNGFLQVEGEKMAKSAGNFVTIRELLGHWAGDVLRLNMLKTHYRQPINWTEDDLLRARSDLLSWSELIALNLGEDSNLTLSPGIVDPGIAEALADDLNLPQAVSRLHEMFAEVKRGELKLEQFIKSALFLGFQNLNKPGYFHPHYIANLFRSGPQIGPQEEERILVYRSATANNLPTAAGAALQYLEQAGLVVKLTEAGMLLVTNVTGAEYAQKQNVSIEKAANDRIQFLIDARAAARKSKDFAQADFIRDELAEMGVELEDKKDGTTAWKVKR